MANELKIRTDLQVAADLAVGDDLTVAGDAAITGTLTANNISSTAIPVITPWTDHSGTISFDASWGTVTEIEYWVKQVTDTLYVRGKFKSGTPTGSPAVLPLPSGVVIDETKLTSNASMGTEACHMVGYMTQLTSSQNSFASADIQYDLYLSDTDLQLVQITNNVKDYQYLARDVDEFSNADDVFTFQFEIPIEE